MVHHNRICTMEGEEEAMTFNLSDQMIPSHIKDPSKGGFFLDVDIKEFIKLLKEEIDNPLHEIDCSFAYIEDIIDKLAGDKLT